MAGAILASRVPRRTNKSITFDGTAVGLVGTPNTVFTVTGCIWVQLIAVRSKTLLASVSNTGTIALGCAGNTGAIYAATTVGATTFAVGNVWNGTSPAIGIANVSSTNSDFVVNANMILTYATNNVTAGVLAFEMWWLPLSADGNVT